MNKESPDSSAVQKKTEFLLRAFIDSSPDSICIRDRDRRLILWNAAFANSVKECCGVDVCQGMQAEDYIPADVFEGYEEQRKSLYRAYEGDVQTVEFAYLLPDGTTRHFDVRWSPVYEGDDVVAVAEITRDVTSERQAQMEQLKLNKLLRGYMDTSFEAINGFKVDPPMPMSLSAEDQVDYLYNHAKVEFANAAWARESGYDRWGDMIGLALDDIVPRTIPENVELLKNLAEVDYRLQGFITHDLNSNGELRIVLNNHTSEIVDGHLVRTWGTQVDITERMREQEEAGKRLEKLTPRESEIMTFVIAGLLNKQIAGKLDIAEDTVKIHRRRIMRKLEITSVAELTRFCAKAGITPAQCP